MRPPMTRPEAKRFAGILTAYSEGKTIEFFEGGEWQTGGSQGMLKFTKVSTHYRIKPEPVQSEVEWLIVPVGSKYRAGDLVALADQPLEDALAGAEAGHWNFPRFLKNTDTTIGKLNMSNSGACTYRKSIVAATAVKEEDPVTFYLGNSYGVYAVIGDKCWFGLEQVSIWTSVESGELGYKHRNEKISRADFAQRFPDVFAKLPEELKLKK